MSGGLTAKQAAFIREYLVDLNASAAARRAGYSHKTAGIIGFENLEKPKIKAAIDAAMKARAKRTEITQDRVLEELARIGFADVRDLIEWDEEHASFVPSGDLSDADAAAISEVRAETTRTHGSGGEVSESQVKLRLKTYDKLSALEKLGKHLGMFDESLNLRTPDGPLEITVKRTVVNGDS